jgi:hypothetical protein
MNARDFLPIEPAEGSQPRDVTSKPLDPDLQPRPEKEGARLPKAPFYGRPWFAYVMGALITAGGALSAWSATHYIGVGIIALCGGYMTWAGIDKVRNTGAKNWIDAILEAIRAALEALQKWIKKHKR